mmetsp:Transcript_88691/g.140155  ORF Transcript_88691/g.140155 Transcript_88691/m.140155 type:complete len:1054 (-) Transcript_88691:69-3230(-)
MSILRVKQEQFDDWDEAEDFTDWTCGACGFSNKARNKICGGEGNLGCKAPRPMSEVGEFQAMSIESAPPPPRKLLVPTVKGLATASKAGSAANWHGVPTQSEMPSIVPSKASAVAKTASPHAHEPRVIPPNRNRGVKKSLNEWADNREVIPAPNQGGITEEEEPLRDEWTDDLGNAGTLTEDTLRDSSYEKPSYEEPISQEPEETPECTDRRFPEPSGSADNHSDYQNFNFSEQNAWLNQQYQWPRVDSASASAGCMSFGTEDDEDFFSQPEKPEPLALDNTAHFKEEEYEIDKPTAIGAPIRKRMVRREEHYPEPSRTSTSSSTTTPIDNRQPDKWCTPRGVPRAFAPGSLLPAQPWLHISGRGSNHKRKIALPDVDAWEPAKIQCPHGCKLQVKTQQLDTYSATVHIRSTLHKGEPVMVSLMGLEPSNTPCPYCERHMAVSLGDKGSGILAAKDRQGNAFMACLWPPAGANEASRHKKLQRYIADALILGYSLRENCFTESRVLLVTHEVTTVAEIELLKLYWEIKIVKHLDVHPSRLNGVDTRFQNVFTKIRCWEQSEYTKICVMDLDIVLTRGIDEIFGFQTPAALFRGNAAAAIGEQRNSATLYSKETGEQQGGINAGVMLIEPNLDEFNNMAGLLRNKGRATAAPEQDFLSLQFHDRWQRLPVKYNWQPHQLKFIQMRGLEDTERQKTEEIAVYHFSGEVSPRDFLFDPKLKGTKDGSNTTTRAATEDLCISNLIPRWGGHYATSEDQDKFEVAIKKWYAVFFQMWDQIIGTTVGDAPTCPACYDEDGSVEHAFLSCRLTKTYKEQWKADKRYPHGDKSQLNVLRTNMDIFASSLLFVARVCQARHPQGAALEAPIDMQPEPAPKVNNRGSKSQTNKKEAKSDGHSRGAKADRKAKGGGKKGRGASKSEGYWRWQPEDDCNQERKGAGKGGGNRKTITPTKRAASEQGSMSVMELKAYVDTLAGQLEASRQPAQTRRTRSPSPPYAVPVGGRPTFPQPEPRQPSYPPPSRAVVPRVPSRYTADSSDYQSRPRVPITPNLLGKRTRYS